LTTRAGNDIPNEVIPEPDPMEYAKQVRFLKKYGKNWQFRRAPGGGYNCAGHVWGSRKTSILEEGAARQILLGVQPLRFHAKVEDQAASLYLRHQSSLLPALTVGNGTQAFLLVEFLTLLLAEFGDINCFGKRMVKTLT
jgi:hypothetical protein